MTQDGNEIAGGDDSEEAYNKTTALKKIGDGLGTSVVTAPVFWIARQASSTVFRALTSDEKDIPDHPLLDLLEQPNEYYTHSALWMALAIDYTINGNAYIEIERYTRGDRRGEVRALYWLPSTIVKPEGSDTQLITHYEINDNKDPLNPRKVQREDMIHIRYGISAGNMRVGLCPIQSLINDVFTDIEASLFTAAILNNFGFPGIIVSPPDSDPIGPAMDEEKTDAIKERFRQLFNRGNRGDVGVFSQAMKVTPLQVDMMKMDVQRTRQLPESRVCAVLGVPAAVVGFALGIQQTAVGATMTELRKEAYESSVTPFIDLLVDGINMILVPNFVGDVVVSHDRRKVRILREWRQASVLRLWEFRLRTRNQTLTELGYPDAPTDGEAYYDGAGAADPDNKGDQGGDNDES